MWCGNVACYTAKLAVLFTSVHAKGAGSTRRTVARNLASRKCDSSLNFLKQICGSGFVHTGSIRDAEYCSREGGAHISRIYSGLSLRRSVLSPRGGTRASQVLGAG